MNELKTMESFQMNKEYHHTYYFLKSQHDEHGFRPQKILTDIEVNEEIMNKDFFRDNPILICGGENHSKSLIAVV